VRAPARSPAHRASRRIALLARSVAAAFALACSTVAGVVAAFTALLPLSLRAGPEGRRVRAIGRPRPIVPEPAPPPSAERALPP
jgi:hypothetical protein